jgi:Ca2+-transporting ATPase
MWHTKPVKTVFSDLTTSKDGLSNDEATRRLNEHGENQIKDPETTSWHQILLKQFNDNLVYLLLIAATLSVAVGFLPGEQPAYGEAGIITLIIVANSLFGFYQDYKAEQSIQALKKLSTPNATVVRDGTKHVIDATQVVSGDIIILEQGDAVPADARLIDADNLATDESALTGESKEASKHVHGLDDDTPVADRDNMVYMNTHVVKGRGKAVVTATGMDTEVGAIAEEIQGADDTQTPFQREVDRMGRRIGLFVLGVIALVAVFMTTLTGAAPLTIFLMAISLVVAAVPESLPALVTFSLALGSRRMLAENALVRSLPVVEALGSVNAIVTDKTGTLTEGAMTVRNIYTSHADHSVTGTGTSNDGDIEADTDDRVIQELLRCGTVCNNAERTDDSWLGDPTEIALKVSAEKGGVSDTADRAQTIPFSSDRKRMTVITEDGTAYMKGAPSTVLSRCDKILVNGETRELTENDKERIRQQNSAYASDALRVLGFATKAVSDVDFEDEASIESEMVFLGLQAMRDPPRSEVKDAVSDCRTAGIDVVMATGDNLETAKAIGAKLGFNADKAVDGKRVENASDEELERLVKDVEIFARVSPHHKVRILQALQANSYNVAMTGDGVNDAPALKNSDVGVAMGQRGTDVAKQSSDMILQDDNFVTLRDAIKEGRAIFDNIRKVVNYLLSTNSGEVMLVFLGTIIGGVFFPEVFADTDVVVLTAVMILWVNFATDGPPSIAMGMDEPVPDIMEREPRGQDEPIIDNHIMWSIATMGPLAAVILLPTFFLHVSNTVLAQTILFTGLALFEIVMIQMIRSSYDLGFFDNKYLGLGVAAAFFAQLIVLYTPPVAAVFKVVPLSIGEFALAVAAVTVFTIVGTAVLNELDLLYGSRATERIKQ